ncbi:MAG TPA: alpha-L-rhamnosidase [Porphyromonadaceae bacterium]|nr:alpha-L-rhamnosidase [Porphyromonadaceae bacterium]
MKVTFLPIVSFLFCVNILFAQNNILRNNFDEQLQDDRISKSYVTPKKIVWLSDQDNKYVKNQDVLLSGFDGQLSTSGEGMCILRSDKDKQASILLDYGTELYGGIQIAAAIRGEKKPVKIRVRLGESVSEAMSNAIDNTVPGMNSATNDHSLRDFTLEVPWLGTVEVGNSGFRFVRIDLLDEDVELPIRSIRAIFRYRDIPYLGSFTCDNERLNKIWQVGAYTVHLNMQEYLWDGIKRDRLVWLGDLHPEVLAVNTVFGENEVVRKSLDFGRNTTPLPGWMNGISSYSLWWVIIHRDLYLRQGDWEYLKEQQPYLTSLIDQIVSKIVDGKENLDGGRFLDWPTDGNKDVIHSGLQALTILTLEAGKDIAGWLKDKGLEKTCTDALALSKKQQPSHHGNKQAAALLSLAGNLSPNAASEVILKDGAKDFATFYGYYMLEALAKDGKYQEAIDLISNYWGAMLDLGATTFWENFVYEERINAARIDEIVPEGKYDIHADGGAHCYIGLRGSLCHGWASGPTTWLTEHILGIKVLEPGARVIRLQPHLGSLNYAEGTYPTSHGVLYVKHVKQPDGKIKTTYKAPKGVKVVH